MAEACHSEVNIASALLATGNSYLWGFTVEYRTAAGTVVFDDSTDGTGTAKYRASAPNTASLCHTVMFPKPIHFTNGIYATLTTATVSAIWEGEPEWGTPVCSKAKRHGYEKSAARISPSCESGETGATSRRCAGSTGPSPRSGTSAGWSISAGRIRIS